MIPVFWRYITKIYIQVFSLCFTGFIVVIFMMRSKDVAKFAALNSAALTAFFSLHQILNIVPYVIPISCAVASLILFQKLSHHHELTAARAAGFSFKKIFAPILFMGVMLSFVNFALLADVIPKSKLFETELLNNMKKANPFYIFSNMSAAKLKNTYIDMEPLREGQKAKDVLLVLSSDRFRVIIAKEMSIDKEMLNGKDVTLITTSGSSDKENFDHLYIENQKKVAMNAEAFSKISLNQNWKNKKTYLGFGQLILKNMREKAFFTSSTSEIAKRLSLSLAPFFFTLIGTTFGIEIGRHKSSKKLLVALLLCSFYLVSFVGSKSIKSFPLLACLCYFIAYPPILFFTLRALRKVARGVE